MSIPSKVISLWTRTTATCSSALRTVSCPVRTASSLHVPHTHPNGDENGQSDDQPVIHVIVSGPATRKMAKGRQEEKVSVHYKNLLLFILSQQCRWKTILRTRYQESTSCWHGNRCSCFLETLNAWYYCSYRNLTGCYSPASLVH